MSISLTRLALYDRIWETPLRRLAEEFGVDTLAIKAACDRGGIPRPEPHTGYWTKKELHLPIDQPALGPAPDGCPDLLLIEPTPVRRRQPRPEPVTRDLEQEVLAAPETRAAPETETAEPAVAATEPAKPRPSHPTTLARRALYEAVWQTPMVRLATSYGVSGNGLAKICARYDIPYPARGFWAKSGAGQEVEKTPLPNPKHASEEKITIRPTPPKPSEELPSAVNALEAVRSRLAAIHVAGRLATPHPVIAKWIAEREDRRREARRARQSGWGSSYDPGDFGVMDRRRHRLLDALFKVIEREGGKVKQGKQQELIAVIDGESMEFGLREKRKQTRRPLTPDEAKWASSGDKGWRQELVNTGLLIFEIKLYLPANLPRQWAETDVVGLEDLLPEIASTFITAGPLLAEQSRKRAEAERERQIAEHRRYEEEQRRKRDANRVRRFKELAQDWRDVALAREFLADLRSRTPDGTAEVGGQPVADWLDWVEARLKEADPMSHGAEGIFNSVADITEWSYQERRYGYDR